MTQKAMIIVLVALVVIFLITLGIGGCHGSGKKTDDEGAVGALKGLQGNRFLAIGDKATASPASCGTPGGSSLTVNGACVITFEKRAFFRRSTRVVFRANAMMQVIVVPKDGPRQDETLAPFECFATSVGHAGGTMTMFGNATVFLQRSPCP